MPLLAFMFPGQGAYAPGILAALAKDEPLVNDLLEEIDRSSAREGRPAVAPLLLDAEAPSLANLVQASPPALHLAIFASEIAIFRVLTQRLGLRPDVLIGHSFGELVALTAAGILDLEEGLALVSARDEAFAARPPVAGGMVALGVSASRAAHLLAALGEWEVGVAADNSPRQCVVSGPAAPLKRVLEAAKACGLSAAELQVPYAFHSRGLAAVADDFARRVIGIGSHHSRYRVHSAVLGRTLDTTDDVEDLVDAHLVRPTGFTDAVRALHADGVEMFVECGPRGVLTSLVEATVPGTTVIAPMRRSTGIDGLTQALRGVLPTVTKAAFAAPRPAQDLASSPTAGTPGEGRVDEGSLMVMASGPSDALTETPLPERGALISALQQMYAEALGYPTDVLTPLADLEGDLGVDSIKQTELFAQALSRYGRRLPTDGSRLTSYTTLDALAQLMTTLPSAAAEVAEGTR